MKKSSKIILICAILMVIIAGLLIGLKKVVKKDKVDIVTYKVQKEVYENIIEISGTVSAAEQQSFTALGAGTVKAVYAKEGDYVKKGDVIIQLDDSEEVYNLEKHDYNMATTRLNGSPRELELMETQRKSLVQKIADRQVVASFDGVIVELKTSEGNSVKAADTIGTLVNLDYLTAEVEIPEKDVAKLKVGLPVILEFSASDEKGYGYVTGWPAIGELTNRGASIVRAQIRIDDYPEEILTNYSFTGKIQIEEPVENIIVEQNAITYEDDKSYVTLLRNGEKREVKVIPYGRDYVKVLEGLEGNEVLLQSDDVKKSGSKKNSFNPSNMPSGDNFGGMPGGGGGFGGGGMPGGGMPGGGGGRPF